MRTVRKAYLALASIAAATLVPATASADRPFSWTGAYLGLQVGGVWSDADFLSNHVSGVGTCVGGGFVTPCDPVNHTGSGLAGGVQLGWRWQTGPWVFGLEGSLAGTTLDEKSNSINTGATLEYTSELKSLYTGTVQVGYTWDRTLWYVKGGYAGGEVKFNSTTLPAPSAFGPATAHVNGWTLGTGIEHALARNFSIGLEYAYTRLEGDVSTCTTGAASVFSCGAGGALPLKYADYTSDIHQVMVRLNAKLD